MNKNIIVEIDEGTRQMINQIKDSVASGIDPSINRVEERVRKEMNNVSDELAAIRSKQVYIEKNIKDFSSTIEDLEEQLADLLEGVDKIENIPDFSSLTVGLDQTCQKIVQLELTISDMKSEFQNIHSATDEKIASLDTFCNSQYKKLSGVTSSGFDKLNIFSNELSDRIEEIEDKLKSVKDICEKNLRSLSTRIESSEKTFVKQSTEIVTLHADRVRNELGDQLKLLMDTLSKSTEAIKGVEHNLNRRIETAEENYNISIMSLKKMIEMEIQERKESQTTLETKLDRVLELISGINQSVTVIKDTNDGQYSFIKEKLQQILMTVTPFWKRKNI
ncbi:MAG: hypothetical protein K2N35_07180 [Muribaculaceae bacterium]|nr:hypothetical protein [Muribaculaceae bacterium]